MPYFLRRLLLLSFLTLFLSPVLLAQTGAIRGKVLDGTRLSLPGASVRLPELGRGAVSDEDGAYLLADVPVGTHQVMVSYLGYQEFSTTVTVTDRTTATLPIELSAGTNQMGEVQVLGARLQGQAKALNEQRTNANITNVVAADQIGRFPDANVGDALKRVPGITVLNDQGEARFGLIRGTEPRFNSVTVNGERLPSAEGGTRSVQLDLIPSDMVQAIEVSKTLTPDMDADAIGGTANLVTRAAPNGLRISGTAGAGYNFLSEKVPYLGSLVVGNRFLDGKLGIIASGSYFNHRFGSDNVEAAWDRAEGERDYLTQFEIRKYDVQRIRRSGSVSVDYRLSPNSTLTLRSLYNVRDDFENRYRATYSGLGVPGSNGLTRGRYEIETKGGNGKHNARLERQKTFSNTLSGEHLIASRARLTWAGTYAYASENRPQESYISFRTGNISLRPNTIDEEHPVVEPAAPLNYTTIPFRRYQLRNDNTHERDLNGRIDLLLPLQTEGPFMNSLKVGGRYRDKHKEVAQRRGELVTEEDVTWNSIPTADFSDNHFLANGGNTRYRIGPAAQNSALPAFQQQFNATYEDNTYDNLSASFRADERISGGYAMLNQQLGARFSAIAGLRVEHTYIRYQATIPADATGEGPTTNATGVNSYTNFLPALHLKYNLTDNTILRAAYTNSLARPDYAALAPTRTVDASTNELTEGNPDLKATTSTNFDLMAEHYFTSVGLISGGVFYKDISNFVFTTTELNYTDPVTGNTFLRYNRPLNGNSATLRGAEVAIQRQLDFLPGVLRGLGVYANYTFTSSRANGLAERTSLPGTAKHNWNTSLSYESKRLTLRVSVNRHSGFVDPDEASVTLSDGSTAFRYLDHQLQLDANAGYAFTPKLRLFVEANNLTNQPLRYYQGNRNRTVQSEYYNARFNAGLKFDL
ncbi:TonB-dependent receptor [Hymenobacter aerilatus]|uniref:TonB-dependent receptor n=1 Tax=Hymenobacter aerilatus TaxID=2932251 RepID=A0A8T9ST24_9BACT|nr:TonB-dependent receptor [Hymenobacter aerilatus]UOR05298.1 TonB-dependent receptor [Hymenobacter aerilatus]